MYAFPLNVYQGVELLAYGVCLCSALFDIPKWFENVYSVNGFLESKNQGDGCIEIIATVRADLTGNLCSDLPMLGV